MNRANAAQLLLDQAAKELRIAEGHDAAAAMERGPLMATVHRRLANRYRERAAELISAANYVNGVSPE